MTQLIAFLRDDFSDGIQAAAWGTSYNIGSATRAETGGQAVFTLPSSTAGSHESAYWTSGTYDITGDGAVLNVGTMVATGTSAYAFFSLLIDTANIIRFLQQNGTLKAQGVVGGVTTDLFSATWNASTHKYWRIRESAGIIYWDTSTSASAGAVWTNRASATVASTFPVTALYIAFGANCGNVASPGQFKVDDFNLILPPIATNWHWIEGAWPLTHRFRNVTLAIDTTATVQGYLAIYSSIDTSGNPIGPVYYSGPIDANGNLTVQATQAAAQAMAVNLPLDGRWSLPAMVEARFIRLYCRSIDGSSFVLREQYGRRLIQADDIEAEAIRAHHIAAAQILADHIAAGAITADKIAAGAITAGKISATAIDGMTITGATIRSGASGARWEGNATRLFGTNGSTTQWEVLNSTGKFTFAGGLGVLDSTGVTVEAGGSLDPLNSYRFAAGGTNVAATYCYTNILGGATIEMGPTALTSAYAGAVSATVLQTRRSGYSNVSVVVYDGYLADPIRLSHTATLAGGLNVGTATGAGTGEIRATTSGNPWQIRNTASGGFPGIEYLDDGGTTRLFVGFSNATSGLGKHARYNAIGFPHIFLSSSTEVMRIGSSTIGFFGSAGAAKPTITGSKGGNAALSSLMSALSGLGLVTDSTT